MNEKSGKVLRIVAIVLFGGTVAFTMLGAIGTGCIAWNANMYGKAFAVYVPYMPVYQILVFVKLIVATIGILATSALVRGEKWGYKGAMITLVIGLLSAAIQMYYGSTLKGKPFLADAPTNVRFFITLITLIVFLLLKLPGIWSKVGLDRSGYGGGGKVSAGGLTLFVGGLVPLTAGGGAGLRGPSWWSGRARSRRPGRPPARRPPPGSRCPPGRPARPPG